MDIDTSIQVVRKFLKNFQTPLEQIQLLKIALCKNDFEFVGGLFL